MTVTEFFVSPNGADYWSGTLPEPNADQSDGPFLTLHRARDAMHQSTVKRCFVRGGTYSMPLGPLRLMAEDKDTSYIAYPGETPVFYGSYTVPRDQMVQQGELWLVDPTISAGLDVFCDGTRMNPACFTDTDPLDRTVGWLWAKIDPPDNQTILTHEGALSAVLTIRTNTDMVWVQAFDRERLADGLVPLASIAANGGSLRTKTSMQYKVRSGGTFRLYGASEWLRRAGEFGFSGPTNQLIIWPKGTQDFRLSIPTQNEFILIENTSGILLWGLEFRENKRESPAIRITGSTRISVVSNAFRGVGEAVRLSSSGECDVLCNTVDDTVSNGIYLDHSTEYTEICGNTLSRIGTHVMGRKNGTAIGGNGTNSNQIQWNDITDCARYGISLKDWNANNACYDNTVRFNRVWNTLLDGADGAAIETLGRSNNQTNTRIQDNLIMGVHGVASYWDTSVGAGRWLQRYKGFGIYLDDKTNDVTVQGNVCTGVPTACIFVHGGDNNRVLNNFGVLEGTGRFLRIEWLGPTGGETGKPMNTLCHHNVVLNKAPPPVLEPYWTFFTPGTFLMQQNLVWGAKAWWPDGTDVVADPGFQNIQAGDLRLAPNSPAPSLGIQSPLFDLMGVQGFRLELTKPTPLYQPPVPTPPLVTSAAEQSVGLLVNEAVGTVEPPPPPPPLPVIGTMNSFTVSFVMNADGTVSQPPVEPPPPPPKPPVTPPPPNPPVPPPNRYEPWYKRWWRRILNWF